ncbi:MAG: CPBP family intramembrane metalloprotease [Ferruginibacter sp.]|nr:CPBP family intramembrane metalloprotease [Ferruginibacter sp.]
MAYLASNRFTYWGQLGILTALTGVGLIIGGLASIIPLIGKVKLDELTSPGFINDLLKPENAATLRWMNSITNFFLFFFPVLLYSFICHKKAFIHLGFKNQFNWLSGGVVILIMLTALPLVSALQDLTTMLPWSKASLLKFKLAEEAYNKQVAVMAKMDNAWEYLLSVVVIAFLPALFEETLFRGGIQNLLSRWFKMPVLAIVITAIIFSAVHASYLGFLSRFALGFILGWIYYRTGNLWFSILGHFFNNAFAVTVLYMTSKPGEIPDPSKLEGGLPLWTGIVSIAVIYTLFLLFENISKKEIDRPGEELLIPGTEYHNNPFLDDTNI